MPDPLPKQPLPENVGCAYCGGIISLKQLSGHWNECYEMRVVLKKLLDENVEQLT